MDIENISEKYHKLRTKTYLTVSEVSDYFGVSEMTTRRWIKVGLLKTLRTPVGEKAKKRTIRISRNQIRNFEMKMGKLTKAEEIHKKTFTTVNIDPESAKIMSEKKRGIDG